MLLDQLGHIVAVGASGRSMNGEKAFTEENVFVSRKTEQISSYPVT